MGAAGLVIYPNMARYYKGWAYDYKGHQGRQATTMLFEVEQRECISKKQIDGKEQDTDLNGFGKRPSTLSL